MSKLTLVKKCNFKTQPKKNDNGIRGLGEGNNIFFTARFRGKKATKFKGKNGRAVHCSLTGLLLQWQKVTFSTCGFKNIFFYLYFHIFLINKKIMWCMLWIRTPQLVMVFISRGMKDVCCSDVLQQCEQACCFGSLNQFHSGASRNLFPRMDSVMVLDRM